MQELSKDAPVGLRNRESVNATNGEQNRIGAARRSPRGHAGSGKSPVQSLTAPPRAAAKSAGKAAARRTRGEATCGVTARSETGRTGDNKASDRGLSDKGNKVRARLRATLGEDVFVNWFGSMEFESFDGKTIRVTVAVKFLRNWIQSHYADDLLASCQAEFKGAERVDVALRTLRKAPGQRNRAGKRNGAAEAVPDSTARPAVTATGGGHGTIVGRTQVGGFEGSPLDPRYTFDSFVVGPANRMAHAGAWQVAETIFAEDRSFNPLYLHSYVGLGKTNLLHAIAWEVKRRYPHANVLYLTAERFRYNFVEGLRSNDSMAFKEKFRSIDILLIDDLEFMHGPQTEQEFDHIINWLLDGGRQLVVASAKGPNQLEKLNDRMRSRLQRGLVTEINALDFDLRLKVLEKRISEKRAIDPSFEIPREVIEAMANRLTESGRELEGAITRLYAHWQYMHSPISVEVAEKIVRDLVHGIEPRRIKIEDILREVSRHFGVPKSDILSQRRHRSVVWPRQIGMYLSKQLTSRSLPEIGRRFGKRDHTTVLHAIRKIDKILVDDAALRDEVEELKKLLSNN